MPDALQAIDQATPPAQNPYDLGDTERNDLRTPAGDPPAAPAPPSPPADGGAQGRRADGTFAPKHPVSLVQQAQAFGYSDAEINDFTTAQLSAIVVRALTQRNADMIAAGRQQQVAADNGRHAAPPTEPEEEPFSLGTDENGQPLESAFDPAIVNHLKNQHATAQELKKQLRAQQQREQARLANQIRDAFDDAFAAMVQNDAIAEQIFGKGSVEEITPAQLGERDKLIRVANVDPLAETPRGVARKLKGARDKFYPATTATTPPGQGYAAEGAKGGANGTANGTPAVPVEEWNGAALSRPTQRQVDDEPPGDEKARRTVARHLKNNPRLLGSDDEMGDSFLE